MLELVWVDNNGGGEGGGRVFQNPLFDSLDIRDIHKSDSSPYLRCF